MTDSNLAFDETAPLPVKRELNRKAVLCFALGGASLFLWCLAGIPAIIIGLLALQEIRRSNPTQPGTITALGGITNALLGLALGSCCCCYVTPKIASVPGFFGTRFQHLSNMEKISKAMLAYEKDKGRLPAHAIYRNGQPMLSWRVELLPYLGEKELFDKFKLDEPWNSPHNEKLLERMPAVYRPPGMTDPTTRTCYVVYHGKGAAFEGREGVTLASFTDGVKTILITEVQNGPQWTMPEDLNFDLPFQDRPGLFPGERSFGLADGTVADSKHVPLPKAITRNAGD